MGNGASRTPAELKAGEIDPPTLEGEGYKIAVYDVPGGYFKGDPKKLGEPLKSDAALKREGKPDVKPSEWRYSNDRTASSSFTCFLSAEIGRKTRSVEFDAQIGRIVIEESSMSRRCGSRATWKYKQPGLDHWAAFSSKTLSRESPCPTG